MITKNNQSPKKVNLKTIEIDLNNLDIKKQ